MQGTNTRLLVATLSACIALFAAACASTAGNPVVASAESDRSTQFEPAEVTTPSPIPVPDPAPIHLTGSGQSVSDPIRIESGVARISSSTTGSSNFIVKLLDSRTGQLVELIANEIGAYSGSTVIGLDSGQYVFDVDADGPWDITIDQPHSTRPSSDSTFSGTGPQAVGPFKLPTGLVRISSTHDGSSNFIVKLLDSDGNLAAIPFNEIGEFHGQTSFNSDGGSYWMSIDADGDWTVDLS